MKKITTIYARVSAWALPILALLLLFSFRECNTRGLQVSTLSLDLDSVARRAVHFENERGQLVAENLQLTAKSESDLKGLTAQIFALKKSDANHVRKVQEYARIIQRGEFKDKLAGWVDTLRVNDTSYVSIQQPGDTGLVRVPRSFIYMDSTIYFKGRVTKVGVWLDSIGIENTVHYRTIIKSTGFLRLGRTAVVQAVSSNPAIKIEGITSIKTPLSWWQRWGKLAAGAVLGGIAIDYLKRSD